MDHEPASIKKREEDIEKEELSKGVRVMMVVEKEGKGQPRIAR